MRYFNELSVDILKVPRGICSKTVSHKSTHCYICNYRNHIRCDQFDEVTNNKYKKPGLHMCKICKEDTFAFQKLSDDKFFTSIVKNVNEDLNLRVTPVATLKTLFNDFSASSHNDGDTDINCQYYDLSSNIPFSSSNRHSMFHLNVASLGLHKEELVTSLSLLDFELEFDLIAVSETKINANVSPIHDLSLTGYKYFHTPTESEKGGVIIYAKRNIDIKRRHDLENKMYKARELESVFLVIINEGKRNEIFGCVYRHPSMPIDFFNENVFNEFMEKLASENKVCYMSGDFNIDLLKIDSDKDIMNFYNSLTSNLFVPRITLPTRITSHSQALIDNIFSNDLGFAQGISGNFIFSISDHLAQFPIMLTIVLPKSITFKCEI